MDSLMPHMVIQLYFQIQPPVCLHKILHLGLNSQVLQKMFNKRFYFVNDLSCNAFLKMLSPLKIFSCNIILIPAHCVYLWHLKHCQGQLESFFAKITALSWRVPVSLVSEDYYELL